MTLATLAHVLDAPFIGADAEFSGVSTDTRTLNPADLFVALTGPNHDGHDFLGEAARRGAAGALLARESKTVLPCVRVADTRRGLGALAAHWRRQFDLPVIAVTGSNGKTTVKEMIAAIMAETGPGCATHGNLNNDIGAPLSLLRLRSRDRHAVIELGMNRQDEMRYLATMTQPTVAVVTNAAEAHLEGIGSVADVAREKGEVFSALGPAGIAIINADDDYADLWRSRAAPRRCITFGLQRRADVSAEYQLATTGSALQIKTTQGEIDMRLPLLGQHNVANALAAAASALAAGAEPGDVKRGIEKLRQVSGRLELKQGINGARIIDDTYNANPASLSAGIAVLRDFPGEAVLVMGDMVELGEAGPDIHRRVGTLAKRVGIAHLFAIGELSKLAVDSFGAGARHFPAREALVENLVARMHADMTILIKGSRCMHMEHVLREIVNPSSEHAPTASLDNA
ncbi:MAG: UDP-N-acetylmuramoyl-tripeptide--D-alanyl-D-alanine ligase [Acidiferrobacterales bacterium]